MSEQQIENLTLKQLQQQLQQALALIQQNTTTNFHLTSEDVQGLGNTKSLLERCEAVVTQQKTNNKPALRVVHHFACSGGTLISKCLASQPNVFLLSELHPTTRLGLPKDKASYTPHDVVTQAIYGKLPNVDNLAEKLFVQNIIETEKHVRELGGYLVVRAHTHADYCTNAEFPEINTFSRLLEPYFDIKHLVTVRNPIDSFLSLRQNGWVHFAPDSFEEYCHRLLSFLSGFDKQQIVKYEDFVEQPESIIKVCIDILELSSKQSSLDYIDVFKVSGDSGRGGVEILRRERKSVSDSYRLEIENSKSFKSLINYGFF